MSKMFTVQLYDLPRGVQKKFLSGIVSNFNFPPEQTKSFDFFPGLTLTEVYSRYRANLQTAHFKIWQNETVHRMRYFLLVILSSFGAFLYRVSHKTWQLVNSLECLLPYTVFDITDLSNHLATLQFMEKRLVLLITNCHVLWDTLYKKSTERW